MSGKTILSSGAGKRPDTGRTGKNLATILAFSFAASLAAPAAISCGFHNTIPETRLDGMYPGSLSVAVALRNAADRGVIDAAALDAPRNVATLFLNTMPRLQRFRKTLDASATAAELPASFSLGYVESGLWTRFSQSDGKVGIKIHYRWPQRKGGGCADGRTRADSNSRRDALL
ncbi:hypothetical protein [uncultured Roseibium sp.]|uniref:hypothetical protein n=1 Tax=uncultured Roseibium sp. TaxID=1936171 RepID=UPI0032178639